eukprot:CAMPEP_0175849366 /NCGR_PEP_ID=MMETSP0107_2-20121207/24468_1 /TAXON_ID=195067 ORGANISM="Goniomonas pacifica, Strain CCMP1869" /NCGR_SAMPLE_ID=MMETSP0107_2 /ASSEMBLY_ACC=CAM_ASM_000203 /LENGTH=73 /DNA_ID=CAMNT_0017164483 /DNA_START=488 /DNA_END=706 /DNA_ORIENTATION=+
MTTLSESTLSPSSFQAGFMREQCPHQGAWNLTKAGLSLPTNESNVSWLSSTVAPYETATVAARSRATMARMSF